MTTYIVRRLILAIPSILGILTVVFLLLYLTPGDPVYVMLGYDAPQEAVQVMRHKLGLDQPFLVQYAQFLGRYVRADLGRSLLTGHSIKEDILYHFPFSASLAASALIISLAIGIPVGIATAVYRNTGIDYALMVVALIGVASPAFWLAIVGIYVFALKLGWFPILGAGVFSDPMSIVSHLVLPASALGLRIGSLMTRLTRASILEILNQDYIRTARAKGLSQRVVLYKHALRNALLPVITVTGLNMGGLLGGAVLVETVFARPGLGKYMIDAILARDFPVVQATTFTIALGFIIINLVTDLTYGFADPRIRYD